ncbi:MAG: 3-isopropylmalate dehydratase large subunit [Sporomusa sp.]|jgi:3-isopropylmalate/(R)-2-methylmalate dehydratase large subunit|nr:3-isopropylmalate dehydratase large subunit [Sporomusa sp.]
MGLTIVQKIMAAHCDKDVVQPGEIINARVDMVFGNELGAGLAIEHLSRLNIEEVFDKSRVAIIPDHFTPNKDVVAAEQCKYVREFARKSEIEHYFEVGRMGIEHVIMHEKGLVVAGELLVGADSHTCTHGALGCLAVGVGGTDLVSAMVLGEIWLKVPETIKIVYHGTLAPWVTGKDLILYTIGKIGIDGARYKMIEFAGAALSQLSMDSRFAMANMVVEAGAKSCIFTPDQVMIDYLDKRAARPYVLYSADEDAQYEQIIDIDVSDIELQVAYPHLPSNVKSISKVSASDNIKVDQVFLGSCTNGRLEDLRLAAEILKGKKIHPHTRMIVIPGSQEVYSHAIEEGLISIFIAAGAAVGTPTCGPCIGGHMGVLAAKERCVATTNRNFPGRMGHMDSEVYLAGPAVAAASAIAGHIAAPWEVLR